MFGPVRAVIVDDEPSHLFAISTGFAAAGIPCTSYWYDRDQINIDQKLKPAPPEEGCQYLRIIFSDLNLDERPPGGGLADVIQPVIHVISRLVKKNSGPYGIVFWTQCTYPTEDIKAVLIDRLTRAELPVPIAVSELDKSEYIYPSINTVSGQGDEILKKLYKFSYKKANKLKKSVENVIRQHGLLLMISEWESRAIYAAGHSTNSLFKVATVAKTADDDLNATMRKIAALVSGETMGVEGAKAEPHKAYDLAMQGMLFDAFGKSVNDKKYSKIFYAELNEIVFNKTTPKEINKNIKNKNDVYATLNTALHIDVEASSRLSLERGVVLDLNNANKGGLRIDKKSACDPGEFFYREGQDFDDVTWSDFIDSLKWVLIEVGAACDHAQKKERTIRFLIGVKVPIQYLNNYVSEDKKKIKLKNEALQIFGPYEIQGEKFYLMVSIKRFVSWQLFKSLPRVKILFRLRQEIVDSLLTSYAAWSMRPGITQFQK